MQTKLNIRAIKKRGVGKQMNFLKTCAWTTKKSDWLYFGFVCRSSIETLHFLFQKQKNQAAPRCQTFTFLVLAVLFGMW